MGSLVHVLAAVLCASAIAFNRRPSSPLTKFLPDDIQEFDSLEFDSELYAAPPALHKNVPFKKVKGKPLTLDIHMPNEEAPNKSLPAMIYFHGGSWIRGEKETIHKNARRVLAEGYALVSIDYRLVSQSGRWGGASVTWPAQGEDAADAVKFLRQHGSKYGIDSKRLGCWGDSAGGQLCAWLATAGALATATKLKVAVVMFSPSCMLCWPYGSIKDCSADWYFGFEVFTLKKLADDRNNLTAEQTKQLKLVQSAEATYWIGSASKGKSSPTFIGHGKKDTSVPQEKAHYFAKALAEAGVSHRLEIVPNGGHEYQGWPDKSIDKAIAFIKEQMPVH